MNGKQIPGYYFDSEKNKYFKVQPNHVAPPGSKYSKENVARENEKSRKRRRVERFKAKKTVQTVKRSPMLGSAYSQLTILREQGLDAVSQRLQARATIFASRLKEYPIFDANICSSCGNRDIVNDFAFDPASKEAMVWSLSRYDQSKLQYIRKDGSNLPRAYDLAAFNSDITSININDSGSLVATTLENNAPGNVYIAGPAAHYGTPFDRPPVTAPVYLSLGQNFTALWTSAANPSGARDMFAVGYSSGAFMLSADGNLLDAYIAHAKVRGLDWLNPTTCIGGTSSNAVFLWDTRAWGSRVRFRHSDTVTSVHSLGDGNQILVGGLQSMAIYDVRMMSKRDKSRRTSGRRDQPSDSILKIDINCSNPRSAIDVQRELQLVAHRDDGGVVQLYSLQTGKHIRSLGQENYGRDEAWIRRLRFNDFHDDGVTTALAACKGSTLFQWDAAGWDDDDDKSDTTENDMD